MGKKKHYNQTGSNQAQQAETLPQDHKPADKAPKIYQTSSGFRYKITENLYDMRLVDALVTMQDPSLEESERSIACMKALRLLLGNDQKEALFAHIKKRYGWVPPKATINEMMEIIANFEENKKK